MKENILISIRLTIVCLIIFSGVYTAVLLGFVKILPGTGNGEVIFNGGRKYYANVGQKITDDRYFNSRPSAVEYNASGASGSNKGPSNPEYLAMVQARIDTFHIHNPDVAISEIPSDLVTASGSGLDPNISVQAAMIQIKRISKIRGIAEGNLQQLVLSNTEKPLLGFLGTEKINTLKLNIALDNLK